MKFISESAEHHYLNAINDLKDNPDFWAVLDISFAKMLDIDDVLDDLSRLDQKLQDIKNVSDDYVRKIQKALGDFPDAMIYQFTDMHVLALVHVEDDSQAQDIQKIYKKFENGNEKIIANYGVLAYEIYQYQKLVDQKFISAKLIEALENMAADAQIKSLPLRRERRDAPVILIVEDDRFTASYTMSLLNKEFDVVCAKNGEDAICKYIEHAPDSVFLDINLPGISGQQTLKALKAVDPDAFVVMLSVDTIEKNIKQASQSGAFGFLKKPFSKERLVKTARQSPFIKDTSNQYHLKKTRNLVEEGTVQ